LVNLYKVLTGKGDLQSPAKADSKPLVVKKRLSLVSESAWRLPWLARLACLL